MKYKEIISRILFYNYEFGERKKSVNGKANFKGRDTFLRGFPDTSVVKNLPAMQELQQLWIRSLGQEDPLEEGTVTHTRSLTWSIPWTELPGGLQSVGLQRVGHN